MTEQRLKAVLQELVDENPFAVRAVLKIVAVEFTTEVPTLAVTRECRPRLLVNLGFVSRHCRNDAEVRAVLCHELLHVLLAHTERHDRLTPALHLALDAVINAVIHRQLGPACSAMMSRYYGDVEGLEKLLRPMNASEERFYLAHAGTGAVPEWAKAWHALYPGRLVVDDIEELAEQIAREQVQGRAGTDGADRASVDRERGRGPASPGDRERRGGNPFTLDPSELVWMQVLLGNHDDLGRALPDTLRDALERAMREMNGEGIWRAPRSRGVGAHAYEALFTSEDSPMRRWERRTLKVLKEHLEPDKRSRAVGDELLDSRFPVLTPSDRRGFVRALSAPFLPDCTHHTIAPRRMGTAQVYLDVSGSMNAEMPVVIALLARLSRYIRRPFWAFSDEVAPAKIARGQLLARTTGGTSLACVLDHVERTRPGSAVIVTDGYVEALEPARVRRVVATRLHAIVTRDGNPSELKRLGIPYTQLERLPS